MKNKTHEHENNKSETNENKLYDLDLFQPKMSPTLSFSGMYQKSFIRRRNSTNSQ